jgi:hypothetical protein
MISGFLNGPFLPKTNIFGDPKIPKQKSKSFKTYLVEFQKKEIQTLKKSKRVGPNNPNDLSNNFLEILDIRSISTRKHEMENGNTVPISSNKTLNIF